MRHKQYHILNDAVMLTTSCAHLAHRAARKTVRACKTLGDSAQELMRDRCAPH
jgi:hypothetical protein